MKKRELSSPSLRETKEDNNQTKKIGCMPGIFFFFHRNNHRHSRKRLTSGKKEKNVESTKTTTITTSVTSGEKTVVTLKRAGSLDVLRTTSTEFKKTACDMPRSPTLSAAIRLENSPVGGDGGTGTSSSPATPRKPPALVARLMGLDEIPVSPPGSVDIAEKRRKLLGALEKCDEDLKTLKKIIDAVRLAESRKLLIGGEVAPVVESSVLNRVVDDKEYSEHELSPVSVINGIGSPSSPSQEEQEQQQHPSPEFRQGIHDRDHDKKKRTMMVVKGRRRKRNCKRSTNTTVPFFHRATIEGVPRNGGSGGGRKWIRSTPSRCSKAKEECVEEVCKDGIVEQRWEFGRVGVALEGDIFKDMVDEMVEEFAVCWSKSGDGGGYEIAGRLAYAGLPFDGCRRRLCF